MAINAGDAMPAGVLGVVTESGPAAISTEELFSGKKVVLFTVPGAFTGTCSEQHVPGYVQNAAALREKGVDTVACLSVNDIAVMQAWGEDRNVGDAVTMLADGNCDYARALGLEVDLSAFGMGFRAKRAALVVDDGVATTVAVEEPGQFEVSKAESILEGL